MARVYSEEFHNLVDVYGDLFSQIEETKADLEEVQEEISSLFEDLYGGMEEAWRLLRKLEQHALPILTRSDMAEQSVVKVQDHADEKPIAWDLPELSDQELPFADN
jgi:hypothetical protein